MTAIGASCNRVGAYRISASSLAALASTSKESGPVHVSFAARNLCGKAKIERQTLLYVEGGGEAATEEFTEQAKIITTTRADGVRMRLCQ